LNPKILLIKKVWPYYYASN